ncbi:MAG: pilus assembly protein TadG-related protein, partial [Anaerolineae bacterium]|nr:pilus assembly protein TadG-related protein [Anaerolineae bacterium]
MLDKLQQIEAIIHRFSKRFPASEEGQSIVVVALFLFFVFLAFAAVGIDGTIVYLRRRQLQNIADAAALAAAVELTQTRPITAAYQAAMDTVETNGGQVEWFSTSSSPDPPNTNVGSSLDLTTGIEITGSCDVRVALRWNDIGTYF